MLYGLVSIFLMQCNVFLIHIRISPVDKKFPLSIVIAIVRDALDALLYYRGRR